MVMMMLLNRQSGALGSFALRCCVTVCLVLLAGAVARGDDKVVFGPWKLEGWNKDPGFKARITQGGLDFLKDVGLKMLEQQIGQLSIPDIHGSTDIGIGDVKYDVTKIRISSFGIPSSSLATNPSAGGLTLKADNVHLGVHGDWHYKVSSILSDSGSFDASASGISLTVTLRIGVDASGRPSISSKSSDCYFHVPNLSVSIHGGASWFYNLFDDQIADSLKDSLNDQICKTLVNEVNTNLEKEMQTLQVVTPIIEDVAEIDYSLVASPSFNGTVDTAHKGEVYAIGKHTECPLPVNKIPADPDTSRMVFLWITEYLPNSAGYVLQNVGYLQYNVTPDNVPDEYKSLLNTSNFAFTLAIPEINKLYPNMAMQISLNSTMAPAVTITPSGIKALLVGDFSPYAILPNKSLAYLFTLNVSIKADANVNFKSNNITWVISSFSTSMATVRSTVGSVFTSALQLTINTAIKATVIPYLNGLGAGGVPLPQLSGFNFTKPTATFGQGFLKIGTDLTYTA